MTQQNESDKPSALKRFGQAVAKRNGAFTWVAFAAIGIAVLATIYRSLSGPH